MLKRKTKINVSKPDVLKIEHSENGELRDITIFKNKRKSLEFSAFVTEQKCRELLKIIREHMRQRITYKHERVVFTNATDKYLFEFIPVYFDTLRYSVRLDRSEPKLNLAVYYPNPKSKKGATRVIIHGTKKQIIGELYRFIRGCFPDMYDAMLEGLLITDLFEFYSRVSPDFDDCFNCEVADYMETFEY